MKKKSARIPKAATRPAERPQKPLLNLLVLGQRGRGKALLVAIKEALGQRGLGGALALPPELTPPWPEPQAEVFESPNRLYRCVAYPEESLSVERGLHGVILVASALDPVAAEVQSQLELLAHAARESSTPRQQPLPRVVVFLGVRGDEDPARVDRAEVALRELFQALRFPQDEIPILRGALSLSEAASASEVSAERSEPLLRLVEAIDDYFPAGVGLSIDALWTAPRLDSFSLEEAERARALLKQAEDMGVVMEYSFFAIDPARPPDALHEEGARTTIRAFTRSWFDEEMLRWRAVSAQEMERLITGPMRSRVVSAQEMLGPCYHFEEKRLLRRTPGTVLVGYAHGFTSPPYGLRASWEEIEALFGRLNELFFDGFAGPLDIRDWSTDWRRITDPRSECWVSYLWTVLLPAWKRLVAVFASASD